MLGNLTTQFDPITAIITSRLRTEEAIDLAEIESQLLDEAR
jgi:hypothetical protein